MASSGVVSTIGGPLRTGVVRSSNATSALTRLPTLFLRWTPDRYQDMSSYPHYGLVNGVALAIPMNIAKNIATHWQKQGYIKRGYLVSVASIYNFPQPSVPGAHRTWPAYYQIDENSPAEQAFDGSDILVAVDSH